MNVIYSTKTPSYQYDDTLLIKDMWDLGVSGSQIAMSIAKAQKIHQLSPLMGWSIRIVVSEAHLGKFKETDRETNLDRLKFLTRNFKQPEFPVTYTIATVEDIPYKDTEIFTSLWPFEKQWIGDGDYIMVYRSHSFGFDSYTVKTRGIPVPAAYKYNIVEFDYSDPWDKLTEKLIHCKCVVSERTTLAALCLFTNTPTFMVSQPKLEMYLDGEMRPLLYGNGNLGMSWNIDHYINNRVEQKYFDAPFKNINGDDLEDEMRNWLGR